MFFRIVRKYGCRQSIILLNGLSNWVKNAAFIASLILIIEIVDIEIGNELFPQNDYRMSLYLAQVGN